MDVVVHPCTTNPFVAHETHFMSNKCRGVSGMSVSMASTQTCRRVVKIGILRHIRPEATCPSERSAEGAGLERSEQRVQLGEVGAHSVLLPFHGLDDRGEAVLEFEGWQWHAHLLELL